MTPDEEDCLNRVVKLEEENRQLRRSAEDFGRLAERLSHQLVEEKRGGGDRRGAPRQGEDRRRPAGPTDRAEHRRD